jgi:hypothetical protein
LITKREFFVYVQGMEFYRRLAFLVAVMILPGRRKNETILGGGTQSRPFKRGTRKRRKVTKCRDMLASWRINHEMVNTPVTNMRLAIHITITYLERINHPTTIQIFP